MTNEQHKSQRYITLDWDEVEAWVKNNSRATTNVRGGYYTACPVPTHRPDSERISVWLDDEEHVGLYCWGSCKYRDVLEVIDKAIKTNAAPDTKPPATGEARIKELDKALTAARNQVTQHAQKLADREDRIEELTAELAATSDQARQEAQELEQKLTDADAEHAQEPEQALADANAKHARELADRDSHIENLEAELPVSKSEVISSAWSLLDTKEPNAALIEAVRILDNKLRQALRDELAQNQRIDRPHLLDRALEMLYIDDEQYEHLRLMNQMRNKYHYDGVRFTKSQLRAALAYLELVIDQLQQRSQQPER